MTDAPALTLLPCPFCGGEASNSVHQDESLWSHNIVDWHFIRCRNCDIEMRQCEGFDEVLEAWNTRAPINPQPSA